MKHIQIILLAIVSLYTISCEDVIDIELNSVEPRIVIEAKLYDKFFPASVIITKTTDFFDTISFNTVSGAEVYITDNLGTKVNIPETDTAGLYQFLYFGEVDKTYTLSVKSEGKEYTSTAKMKASLGIDSLSAKFHGSEIPYMEAGYELTCHIKDKKGVNEFASLNLYKNFEKSSQIYLFDDTYVDGLGFAFNFYAENFQKGDTALVEMWTCERSVYDYLYTYAEIVGSFYDSGTPYNPTSNISNNALGYFGVFSLNGAVMEIGKPNSLKIY